MNFIKQFFLIFSIIICAFSNAVRANMFARFAVVAQRFSMHKPVRFMSATASKQEPLIQSLDLKTILQKFAAFRCLDGRKYGSDETGRNSAWRCQAKTTIEHVKKAEIEGGDSAKIYQVDQVKHACEKCGLLWTAKEEAPFNAQQTLWSKLKGLFN